MAKSNGKSLVVVESPAKARTIARILGADYDVKASVGHVRDLPERDLGVEVENGFTPKYVVPKEKAKTVKEIRDAAKKAGTVYLATDPDREGEAIAWHLLEAADLGRSDLHRVVFHEITPEAVRAAFDHPRLIDMNLVDAQQARRVVDRLVGFKLSPFLWRKVRKGLSAGRVQSVAVRLVAEREREILGFQPVEFWTIEARLEKQGTPPEFKAKLAGVVGKREKLEIGNETEAQLLLDALRSSTYSIQKVQTKPQVRRPAAPFITSTLQQEASRRLGMTTKRTMALAQQLYEGISLGSEGEVGLITYMRTDSTNVAASAIAETRAYIDEKYGKQFLPSAARVYTRKVKGAQEAHEAIRPTSTRREPDAIRSLLNNDQFRLYNLIWQRMVSSQMADALFDQTTVDVEARHSSAEPPAYLLKATNTQLRFPGHRQVYIEGRDDEDDEDLGNNPLPTLSNGDELRLKELSPEQKFTEPPARFTEATLIKALEEKGIGRPSTYAPTMTTIQDRGYVDRDGRSLKPTDLGFVVNDLLVDNFPDFVNASFTAQMEDELDEVADGTRKWQPVVEQFYTPLEERLGVAIKEAPKQVEETDEVCPESGHPMVIRWGRNGRFMACSGFPECKYTRPLEGEAQEQPQAIEDPCPECGKTLLVRRSKRGPFVGCSGYPECRYTRPLEGEQGGAKTAAVQATDEKCPECESPMVIRSGRFGQFLACSKYPECKGAKPLPTGAKCPKDGGELIERRTRRGTFYGCANYPECDFTVRDRPLPQPCPACGALLTTQRDESAKCTSCDWTGETPAAEPTPEPAAV